MISDIILSEILSINQKLHDVTLTELTDELSDLGFQVVRYYDHDFAIEIIIESDCIKGSLRVDRLNKRFEVTIQNRTPISGNWAKIHNYLESL